MDRYSKHYLIKIIAAMHDTIQEWDNGYGLPEQEYNALIEVGEAACDYCKDLNDWDI